MTANNSARLLVYSRPGEVKEQFLSSLMLKNTPQPALLNLESWLQTRTPSVQATVQSWFWVSLSNLASDKTLSAKVLQQIDCAHAFGSCLPKQQIRGPPEICHILKCTVATSSDHGCRELASRGEAFPTAAPPEHMLFIFWLFTTKQTQRGFCSLAIKLPLLCPNTSTKKLA